jgi:hypothetical protein
MEDYYYFGFMKINWKELVLGLFLSFLVLLASFLPYDAYRVKPSIGISPVFFGIDI